MAEMIRANGWTSYGSLKYSGVGARASLSVWETPQEIENTLYGPDGEPLSYLVKNRKNSIGFKSNSEH